MFLPITTSRAPGPTLACIASPHFSYNLSSEIRSRLNRALSFFRVAPLFRLGLPDADADHTHIVGSPIANE
jgi:hypothetical protein